MSQAQNIISRLRSQHELHSWQMTTEMFIQQYNARIYDAREIFGCKCKFGRNQYCQANEHIISDKDNHFIYLNDGEIEPMQMLSDDYHQKLQALRTKWLRETDPSKKKVIEAQGKAIKNAIAAKAGDNKEVKEVYEALL